jgi:transcriptional regulator with XRE-family HTH domain
MFYDQFGKNLKYLRIGAGLSQADISKILKISYQQIQKYEAGTNRMSVEYLYRLKHYYGVPYEIFFKGVDQ